MWVRQACPVLQTRGATNPVILISIIDVVVIVVLFRVFRKRGVEGALPVATFFLLLFPFESQLILPGFFDLTTQRVVVLALAVMYMFSGRSRDKGQLQSKLPLGYTLAALICWMIISTLHSVVVSVSVKTVLSECFDFFLLYYIFAKSLTSTDTVTRILRAVVAAMAVTSIFGLLEIYADWSVLSLFPVASHRFAALVGVADRDSRVQATFGHAILFGGTLALSVPIVFYLLSIAETRKGKLVLWCALGVIFVNLYKTMSRGPWIAAILALASVMVLGGARMRRYVVIISIVTVATLVIRPGVYSSIQNLYGETLDPDTAQGGSYQWRYALYDIAFRHLNNDVGRALWGYGPESFYYLGWKDNFQGTIVPFDSCDSSVAALMIETGYVGLGIVALLLLRAASAAYKQYRNLQEPHRLLCLVLLIDIVAITFMMTNVAIFGWGQQSYLIWVLLSLSVTYSQLVERERSVASPEFPLCSPQLVAV